MLKKIIPFIMVIILLTATQSALAENCCGKSQPKHGQGQLRYTDKFGCDSHRGQKQFGQQFEKWLNELIRAYKDNDREKMGELIKKMQQRIEKRRERMETRGEFKLDFRNMGYDRRGRPGRFQGIGINARNYGFQTGHIRGQGQGYQTRGMNHRGRNFRNRSEHGSGNGFMHKKMHGQNQQGHLKEWDW